MTTATESAVEIIETALRRLPAGRSLLLTGMSWADYERCLEVRDQIRPSAKLLYSRGRLELMTKSAFHERYGYILGRFVTFLCEELKVPHLGYNETSVRREDLERGFEPDEWFYLGPTALRMTGAAMLRELDFRTDPPPDLAIEIEITRSLDDRIDLYAALGIPEIWRFDGEHLTALSLRTDRTYEPTPASRYFPTVPLDGIVGFVRQVGAVENTTLAYQFRGWVRSLPPSPTT